MRPSALPTQPTIASSANLDYDLSKWQRAKAPAGGDDMKVKVVLEPSEEGGFTAYVPSLPGCISEGETVDDALTNIQEAIALYLEPVEDDWVPDEKALVKEVEL
jgi:predicted RNase H-like HicB family nuclease